MVPGAGSIADAFEVTAEVYAAAGAILSERGTLKGVADEGGWWPEFATNEEALDTLMLAIERAGEVPENGLSYRSTSPHRNSVAMGGTSLHSITGRSIATA